MLLYVTFICLHMPLYYGIYGINYYFPIICGRIVSVYIGLFDTVKYHNKLITNLYLYVEILILK